MCEQCRREREEADAALNLCRVLHAQLLARSAAEPQPAPEPDVERRDALHTWLDRVQGWTPELVRAAVRPLYLNLFYRRVFPEYIRREPPPAPELPYGLSAWSGYAPLLHYKEQLCRGVPMDLRGFGCECRRGLVSVVLPVYNGARYLAESIESVLRQSYADLELIIVDDGSTDASAGIARAYRNDPRVRLLQQENRKLPAALNAGFAQARGEFFTWTSADNWMRPGMLTALTQFLQKNSDAEMVYADEELIDEGGEPALGTDFCEGYQSPCGSNRLRRPRDPGALSFDQNNYIGACFLYRAWAARAVGDYCEECFGFEDYDYWLRMNALFRIAHLGSDEVLYSYRLHPDSLSAQEKHLRIAERAGYALVGDGERRRFFADSFDITLQGRHPWFPLLAQAYRRAGHNVFELRDGDERELYRHRVTRAFSKSVTVVDGAMDGGAAVVLHGNTLTAAGREWTATEAAALAYPLLAIVNAASFSQLD